MFSSLQNLRVLDHWTSPGSGQAEKNEDVWGVASSKDKKIDAGFVIDGCTPLADIKYPGNISGATWHAQKLAYYFQRDLNETIIIDPKKFMGDVVNCVRADYEREPGLSFDVPDWAYPSSTFMALVVAPEHNRICLVWIGDSSCIIATNDGAVDVHPPLIAKLDEAKEDQALGHARGSALVKDNMEHHRARRSERIQKGNLMLSLFPDRLAGLQWIDMDLRVSDHRECRQFILATDGLMRAAEYGICGPRGMMRMVERSGLAKVVGLVRGHESQEEQKLARQHAKIRDDATGLWLFPRHQLG